MHRESRHRPRRLKRSGRIDAEKFKPTANVVESPIRRSRRAVVERSHHHGIADTEMFNARTDLSDGAGHFVPDHLRSLDAMIHRAVKNMKVRAADSGVGDADSHFALRGRGFTKVAAPEFLFFLTDRNRALPANLWTVFQRFVEAGESVEVRGSGVIVF